MRPNQRMAVVVVLLAGLGCSEAAGPARSGPGLHIVSGADARDTIQANLSAPLVVEVRDSSGQLRSGMGVKFTPLATATGAGSVRLGPSGGSGFVAGALETVTDAQGRAAVRVAFNWSVGEAGVVIDVAALAAQVTARYTVLPGKAVKIAVLPKDTAVYVGNH